MGDTAHMMCQPAGDGDSQHPHLKMDTIVEMGVFIDDIWQRQIQSWSKHDDVCSLWVGEGVGLSVSLVNWLDKHWAHRYLFIDLNYATFSRLKQGLD